MFYKPGGIPELWLFYFLILQVLTWEWWESLLIIFQLKLNLNALVLVLF